MFRHDGFDQVEALVCQADQGGAAVGGVGAAFNEPGFFQPVDAGRHAAGRHHSRLEQGGRGQPAGRTRAAQRRQGVELALVQAVAGVEGRLALARDQDGGFMQTAQRLHRKHVHVGALDGPLGGGARGSVGHVLS
ncbi:hypothetical protein D3C71_1694110 [compost metagenome]